jgi:hypothetical protein
MQSPGKFQWHSPQKEKTITKFNTRNPECQSNSEQKERCWRYHNAQLKLSTDSNKKRHTGQWNRREDAEISPSSAAIWFLTTAPNHILAKRQTLQQVVLGKWISICRRLTLDPCLSPCTKTNSEWTKDLKIRMTSIKKTNNWARHGGS